MDSPGSWTARPLSLYLPACITMMVNKSPNNSRWRSTTPKGFVSPFAAAIDRQHWCRATFDHKTKSLFHPSSIQALFPIRSISSPYTSVESVRKTECERVIQVHPYTGQSPVFGHCSSSHLRWVELDHHRLCLNECVGSFNCSLLPTSPTNLFSVIVPHIVAFAEEERNICC